MPEAAARRFLSPFSHQLLPDIWLIVIVISSMDHAVSLIRCERVFFSPWSLSPFLLPHGRQCEKCWSLYSWSSIFSMFHGQKLCLWLEKKVKRKRDGEKIEKHATEMVYANIKSICKVQKVIRNLNICSTAATTTCQSYNADDKI